MFRNNRKHGPGPIASWRIGKRNGQPLGNAQFGLPDDLPTARISLDRHRIRYFRLARWGEFTGVNQCAKLRFPNVFRFWAEKSRYGQSLRPAKLLTFEFAEIILDKKGKRQLKLTRVNTAQPCRWVNYGRCRT